MGNTGPFSFAPLQVPAQQLLELACTVAAEGLGGGDHAALVGRCVAHDDDAPLLRRVCAVGVRNELAPATMARAVALSSVLKNRAQLSSSTLSGRPPAGMNKAAGSVKINPSDSR